MTDTITHRPNGSQLNTPAKHSFAMIEPPRLTFIYTYYDNPGMLAYQYAAWANYDVHLRDMMRVIIVDDASPKYPAVTVQRCAGLPDIQIYRVKKDIPWHQDAARNLGADRAKTDWIFCCDIDHVVPERTLAHMLNDAMRIEHRDDVFYTFERKTFEKNVDEDCPITFKPAFNIYLMPRRLYWEVGGYDEDMCGCYGTDGPFRKRLLTKAHHIQYDAHILRVPREVIPDASTTQFQRKGLLNNYKKRMLAMQKRARKRPEIVTLDFEWERVL